MFISKEEKDTISMTQNDVFLTMFWPIVDQSFVRGDGYLRFRCVL
jgi:hypothetical protein